MYLLIVLEVNVCVTAGREEAVPDGACQQRAELQ